MLFGYVFVAATCVKPKPRSTPALAAVAVTPGVYASPGNRPCYYAAKADAFVLAVSATHELRRIRVLDSDETALLDLRD